MTKIYIPQDTVSCALGADAIAVALADANKSVDVEIVRNGSRGLFWLEPLVEVEHNGKRIAIGEFSGSDVTSLLDAVSTGKFESLKGYLGDIEQHDYMRDQDRLTFARAGIADPLCIDSYRALNGFKGLERALALSPQAIVDEVREAGLRGRGGAAFPTGIKWQTVLDTSLEAPEIQKYIVCNADEGDSGTFADRLVMEADPYQLIEGMVIAGLAVGATRGYIYLRSEYPKAHRLLDAAIERAEQANYLGADILGSGKCFDLEVRLGAGAYICGEETSLLNSLEGKRGVVRAKPPLPAIEGFFR